MRAGLLRNKILIEQKSQTTNSIGEPVDTWSTFATVFAMIAPVSGKEYFSASQIQSSVSHKIKIRYISGINTSMRINFNGRFFDIESVSNWQERNKEIEMMCVERV